VVRRRLLWWLGGLALLAGLVAYGARNGGGAPDVRGLSDDDEIRAAVLAHSFAYVDTVRIEPFIVDHLFRRRPFCVGNYVRYERDTTTSAFPAAMSVSPRLVSAFSNHYPRVVDATQCGDGRDRGIVDVSSDARAILFTLGPVRHRDADHAVLDVGLTKGVLDAHGERCTVVRRAGTWKTERCDWTWVS
jgi:hypothetical protein